MNKNIVEYKTGGIRNMKELEELFSLLEDGTSPYQVVSHTEDYLKKAGFFGLSFGEAWDLALGEKYYVNHHGSTIFAFTMPERAERMGDIRIAAAHTDFPCLRIKPNPDVKNASYAGVNVEVYGGAILNTWLDRPLSAAGRVAVKSGEILKPDIRYVDLKKPVFTIPNLAIHMNREVNKGVELNKQIDMIPVFGMETSFLSYLAKELSVKEEDILDFELYIYCAEKPLFVGGAEEFISSPRLDNLTSVAALSRAICKAGKRNGLNVIALFDHEEIGSRTKQGAGSFMLNELLDKILLGMGMDPVAVKEAKYNSMMLSVDVAHALHPNQMGKMDITNQPVTGKGLCIKEACSQSYATDCEAIAVVQQLCEAKKIPYQKFVNRSDIPGGSTLGSIASALLPVKTVDIGLPLLAMHSARELMGKEDQKALCDCVREFFSVCQSGRK